MNQNEIKFIDTLYSFNNYSKQLFNKNKLLFHPYDTNHPNEHGHKLMALEILKKIKQFLNYIISRLYEFETKKKSIKIIYDNKKNNLFFFIILKQRKDLFYINKIHLIKS